MTSTVCLLVVGVLLSALVGAPRCLACTGKIMLTTGVSCQDKRSILYVHNRLRQHVARGNVKGQPPAKMMMEMVWDDELAAKAQQWADRCSETHDNARNVQRFAVGQNMARTWTTSKPANFYDKQPDWIQQIFSWYNEVKHYHIGSLRSKPTGHYTQVIWGDTYLVGCGYSYYYDPARGYTKNYVCNYGPSGNIFGYKPYLSGTPECDTYGMDYSKKYGGLCSEPVYDPLGAYCAYG